MKRKVLGSNPSLAIQRQLIPRCVELVRSPLQRAVIERYATIVQTKQGTRTVYEFSRIGVKVFAKTFNLTCYHR